MYTLQGIIRKGVINSEIQFEKLGYQSNNIANLNTPAYKAQRFEQCLSEDGLLDGVSRTDFKEGSFMVTQRELDTGITGPGFYPVTTKSGEIEYTRDGAFTKDSNGYLMTREGCLLGSGIKIPITAVKTEIKKDGSIYTYNEKGGDGELVGKLPLVVFNNPEGLQMTDGNKFKATEKSGPAELLEKHEYISQYGVERANINVFDTTNEVLRLNASMLASTSLMKVVDDMYNKSINLNQ